MEAEDKIVLVATHAGEDPERATLPFVMANAALVMDTKAVVALQGSGVWLAKKGYAEHVFAAGLPPLKDLMKSFLDAGGRLLVCIPCIKERKIAEADLIEGSETTAAANLLSEILSAKASLTY